MSRTGYSPGRDHDTLETLSPWAPKVFDKLPKSHWKEASAGVPPSA